MNLIFETPSHSRTLSFAAIATRSRLAVDQVEWLAMRAMSLKLVKGVIDQVQQEIEVFTDEPRAFFFLKKARAREEREEKGVLRRKKEKEPQGREREVGCSLSLSFSLSRERQTFLRVSFSLQVSWVQPRVLDEEQTRHLIEQINTLSDKSSTAFDLLTDHTLELI